MGIQIGESPVQYITFRLFPHTAQELKERFLTLCSGTHKRGSKTKLTYITSVIHQIQKGVILYGGKLTQHYPLTTPTHENSAVHGNLLLKKQRGLYWQPNLCVPILSNYSVLLLFFHLTELIPPDRPGLLLLAEGKPGEPKPTEFAITLSGASKLDP